MVVLTKHCKQQMVSRNIPLSSVLTCIKIGTRLINKTDSNKLTIVDNINKIYVVTNKDATIAITTFRKER